MRRIVNLPEAEDRLARKARAYARKSEADEETAGEEWLALVDAARELTKAEQKIARLNAQHERDTGRR